MLKCVAVCCSVLQCNAVCCSVLQCVAVCCSVICSVLQCVLHCAAVCCSVLQCVAVCCSVLLQTIAVCCSVLQCVAVQVCTNISDVGAIYRLYVLLQITRNKAATDSTHSCNSLYASLQLIPHTATRTATHCNTLQTQYDTLCRLATFWFVARK